MNPDYDWFEVHLGDHVTYLKTAPLSRAQLDSCSPTRCLHYGDIHTRSSVTLDTEAEVMPRSRAEYVRNANRLRPGDIVFVDASEDQSGIGKSVEITAVPQEGVVSGLHTIAARFDKTVMADGFKAYLQFNPNFRNALVRLAAGTKVYATTRAHISSVSLALPSISEQTLIADALTDADHLITTLERLIAKKQAIKQGMMQQLLTGKTRLPGFTEPWREIRLRDHVSYVRSVALSRAQLDTESAIRYLHYGDIHTTHSVRLAAGVAPMPKVSTLLAGSAGRLQVGDVVFADASEDASGVGKSVEVASVPIEGVVAGLHTIAARFNKNVLADGFKAYLQSVPEFRNSLLRLAAGTKVLATTRSSLSSIILELPDVNEQRAIAQTLRDADDQIDALNSRLLKAKFIKQGMMQELLTGHTRLPIEGAAS